MAGSFHLVELEKIEAASKGFFRHLAPQLAQSIITIDCLAGLVRAIALKHYFGNLRY